LERRHARRLGLTRLTAPEPVIASWSCGWTLLLALVARRRSAERRVAWPVAVAHALILEIDRRRSWRRAMHHANG
jgi:hypothetical protein